MRSRKQQAGFIPIIVPILIVLAVGLAAVTVAQKKLPLFKPTSQVDTRYIQALDNAKALQGKAQAIAEKGVSPSAVWDQFPEVYNLISDKQFDEADKKIAELSLVLDDELNKKTEADRLATETAKKSAEEAAQKKTAEEAARKAAGQQVSTPQPTAAPQPQAPVTTNAPAGGYSRITVGTSRGTFTVDVIKVDAGGVRIITDSANTSDCGDGCPAMPLADYISRNGGFAGMNGTYFCPPDYSFCQGKTNSFNFFVFNYIAKTFINADKRDYSNAGSAFVFRPGSVQFFRDPRGFGLDTSITGAVACFPTLMADGAIVLNDSVMDDKQRTVKGNRSAIGNDGNTVYMVIARSATVPDMAAIMQGLGTKNAINLDGGGSTAMYYGGYKVGPGRALPNAIVVAQ